MDRQVWTCLKYLVNYNPKSSCLITEVVIHLRFAVNQTLIIHVAQYILRT